MSRIQAVARFPKAGPIDVEVTVRVRLSPRQNEVLQLVADGDSSKEIATALHIAERTVKSYVTELFNKFVAGNRVQLVRNAIKAGVVKP